MISFSGTDLLTMDTKGRVALPARYRQPLSELCGARLKITLPAKPDDRLLVLYPLPEWDSVQAQLKALPSTKPFEFLRRRIVGHAKDIELDKQGRMLLPPELRSEARLEQRIAIVGQINKLEIWSEPLYREAMAPERASAEELDAALAEVSL